MFARTKRTLDEAHPSRLYNEPPCTAAAAPFAIDAVINMTLFACHRDGAKAYLARQREDEPRAKFVVHPSETSKCQRAALFSLLSLEVDDLTGFDPIAMRWWDTGHLTHRRLQGYLWEAKLRNIGGIKAVWEDVALSIPGLLVRGELDAIVKLHNGATYVVEIKGSSRRMFDAMDIPPPEWVSQIYCYMKATGIKTGLLLVECKDSQRFKVFYVPFEPKRWAQIEGWIRDLIRHAAARKLPVINTNHCFFCKYHRFCTHQGGTFDPALWGRLKRVDWNWHGRVFS